MVVQIEIKGDLEKIILDHMKLFPHLNKKAYFIEMAKRQAEKERPSGVE